jgi:acyl-CoA thioesterase FadM
MEAISEHPVRFGELAGTLVHGTAFFNWELEATQELASAVGYSLQEILAAGGIPYAPVSVETSIDRYPRFGESLSVDVTPRDIGKHRVVLGYEFTSGAESLGEAEIVHVTIGPDGTALAIPDHARDRLVEMVAEDTSTQLDAVSSRPVRGDTDEFTRTFTVRTPHIEGADLAYFEEYPRFAAIALEEYLEANGVRLSSFDERYPFRLRSWSWSFREPVHFETHLTVCGKILDVSETAVVVSHEFRQNDRLLIEGTTEYGCFDSSGKPTHFPVGTLKPFEN